MAAVIDVKNAAFTADMVMPFNSSYCRIPHELREQVNTWVLWKWTRDGRKLPDDFTHIPDADYKGANDPTLHLAFEDALAKLTQRRQSKLGLYLGPGVRLTLDGREGWLHVLDLDGFASADDKGAIWEPQAVALWKVADKTYAEVSPSGTGLKIYYVSDTPPARKHVYHFGSGQFAVDEPDVRKYRNRQIEVFSQGCFVAVTGRDPRGELQFLDDAGVEAVMHWLNTYGMEKASRTPTLDPLGFEVPTYIQGLALDATTRVLMGHTTMPENADNIAQVQGALGALNADCGYELWRNYVWAIASLDWDCGYELALQWSMTAADRFNEAAFNRTWESYRPGGVGIGTLMLAARNVGYQSPGVTESCEAQVAGLSSPVLDTTVSTKTTKTPAWAVSDIPAGWVRSVPSFNLVDCTADKLFVGEPPAQDWLVQGVFPAGKVCVLASPPGVGKSFLALHLAAQVAANGTSRAFGSTVYGGGCAAYISAEDDLGEIHRRLASLMVGAPMPKRLYILSLPDTGHFGVIEPTENGKTLRATEAWKELKRQVASLGDVRLIVLDTLQAMSAGNTNDAAEVQPLMNECSELAASTGAAVLLLHHVAKGSTKDVRTALDAAEAIRGSGAIVGSARSAYVLWPPSDGGAEICAALEEPYAEGSVAIGLVAKANGAAKRERTIFLRNNTGLLQDVTARYNATAAANAESLQTELLLAVEKAWHDGAPFAANADSRNGVHSRRKELPTQFRQLTAVRLDAEIQKLLDANRISRVGVKGGFQLRPVGV